MLFVRIIAIVAALAATASALQAGVYSTSEEYPIGTTHKEFYESLSKVRYFSLTEIDLLTKKIPIEKPNRKRALLVKSLLDPFALQRGTVNLTDDQYVNLSAYLIRLGEYDKAIDLLEPFRRTKPDNFLLMSNLASAYDLKGARDLRGRALDSLQMAMNSWPKDFSDLPEAKQKYFLLFGWGENKHKWFRRVEQYHYYLARNCYDKDIPEFAGALFPDADGKPQKLKFVGDSGKYEAGTLAAGERKKLPPQHIKIVQQLLLWFPGDHRLYWLLGELYNARKLGRGDIADAAQIFKEIRRTSPVVEDHLEVLQKYLEANPPKTKTVTTPAANTDGLPLNPWQMLGIGFGVGAVVMLLLSWQMRLLLSRRRSRG